MDLATLGGGLFVFAVIVLADKIDVVVDALSSSDDPLTDFDADVDGGDEDGDDSFNPSDDT